VAAFEAPVAGRDLLRGDELFGLALAGRGELEAHLRAVGDARGRERVELHVELLDAHLRRGAGLDVEHDVRRVRRRLGEVGPARGGAARAVAGELVWRGRRREVPGDDDDGDHDERLDLDDTSEARHAHAGGAQRGAKAELVVGAHAEEGPEEEHLQRHEAPVGVAPQLRGRLDVPDRGVEARREEEDDARDGDG
jgi:hypothetical protein